jgi:carboxymethylenebutenolidase
MGGQLALYAASKNEAIGACVDFYGIHPQVAPDFGRLRSPVLGLFAEKDAYVNAAAVASLQKALQEHGVSAHLHTYPGVDHGFFNDHRPEVYDRAAADDAWNRVLDFFGRNLRDG